MSTDPLALFKAAVKTVPGLAPLGRWVLTRFNSDLHAEQRLLREKHPRLYQSGGRTEWNRYPQLFTALREALIDVPAPKILSFGCSTGEEILSLRTYIPAAQLAGIDLNAHRVATARRRIADASVRLWTAGSVGETGAGQFDAVTCLSVLHRRETVHNWPADPTPFMSFATFEAAILDLDAHVRPGGILLLDHMSFRFSDTSVAASYTPVRVASAHIEGRPLKRYDRNNQPILVPASEHASLWRKHL
jgi:hypothetical protein